MKNTLGKERACGLDLGKLKQGLGVGPYPCSSTPGSE